MGSFLKVGNARQKPVRPIDCSKGQKIYVSLLNVLLLTVRCLNLARVEINLVPYSEALQ